MKNTNNNGNEIIVSEESMNELVSYLEEIDNTTLEQRLADAEYVVKHEQLCKELMSVINEYIEREYAIKCYDDYLDKVNNKHFTLQSHFEEIGDEYLVYVNTDTNKYVFDEVLLESKDVKFFTAVQIVDIIATMILTNQYTHLTLSIIDKECSVKIETLLLLENDFETETMILSNL